jgi:NTP pyrophosphatase (non-canonical NTP hydrolase)
VTTPEYEAYVTSRCQPYTDIPYCIIALNEEAGEAAGWFKKMVLRGNPTGKLSTDDLKGELGDVLFYLTRLASHYGWSLDDVMEFNRRKLDKRSLDRTAVIG